MLRGAHEFDILDEHTEMCQSWDLMRINQSAIGVFDMHLNIWSMILIVVIDERKISIGVFDEF